MFDIFTIVTDDYTPGAAALLNSLSHFGFSGDFYIGCTKKPNWNTASSAKIHYVDLSNFPLWLGNAKPYLIRNHAKRPSLFIDADCVIGSTRFLEVAQEIITEMPMFCVEAILPENDHRRTRWGKRLNHVITPPKQFKSPIYFNSGLFGIDPIRDNHLINSFEKCVLALHGKGGFYEDRDFPMPDQDCLNGLLQSYEGSFQTITPPDVWYKANPRHSFFPLGTEKSSLIYHCTGSEKTWLLKKIPKRQPDIYDLLWRKFFSEETSVVTMQMPLDKKVVNWITGKPLERMISKRFFNFLA